MLAHISQRVDAIEARETAQGQMYRSATSASFYTNTFLGHPGQLVYAGAPPTPTPWPVGSIPHELGRNATHESSAQSENLPTLGFLRLPAELVGRIARYCWQGDGHIKRRPTDFPGPTRLNLRLVCRDLTSKSTHAFKKTFFTHLTGIFALRSLQRLIDISRHPEYASLVQSLTFGHHRLLGLEEVDDCWNAGEDPLLEY